MELKEIIKIFKKQKKIFLGIFFVFVVLGIMAYYFQPKTYLVNLTLNVTRIGTQQTQEYRFDDFYRLQADERFADTVVRWLESPRILTDIYADAKIYDKKTIQATRLSSQMIEVVLRVKNVEDGNKLTQSAKNILNKKIEKLNQKQQNETWFELVGDDPIVSNGQISFAKLFLASILLGLFFSFWGVMIKNYIE